MTNACPECSKPLKYQAVRCVCGWNAAPGTQRPVDRRCAWSNGHIRCTLPGSISMNGGKQYFCSAHDTHFRDPRLCQQIAEDALRNPPKPVADWREEAMQAYTAKHGLARRDGETPVQHVQRCRDHIHNLPPKDGVQSREEHSQEVERQRKLVQNFGPLAPATMIVAQTRKPDREVYVDPRETQPTEPKQKLPGGPLARLAGQLGANPLFLDWAGAADAAEAAGIIRGICQIQSRAELDHNPDAAKLFHERIRRPFVGSQSSEAA